jgi:hypothetical protein
VAEVRLWINDVRVRLLENATTYVEGNAETGMTVNVLEGIATVESDNRIYPIVAGTEINIPLNDRLEAASVPRLPRPSSPVAVGGLSAVRMHREIIPADPFTDAEIQDFRARIDSGDDICGAAPYPSCDSVETLENINDAEDEAVIWTTGTGTVDEPADVAASSGADSADESVQPSQPPPEWVTTIVETIESMAPQIVPIILVAVVLAIITAIVLSLWRRQQG